MEKKMEFLESGNKKLDTTSGILKLPAQLHRSLLLVLYFKEKIIFTYLEGLLVLHNETGLS